MAESISSEDVYESLDEVRYVIKSDFIPIPYNIYVTDIKNKRIRLNSKNIGNIKVRCPPYHVLLDHCVAVLWSLYSKRNKRELSAHQIHWALEFLIGATDRFGQHSKDVAMAIKHLQNALMKAEILKQEKKIFLDSMRNNETLNSSDMNYEQFVSGIPEFNNSIVLEKIFENVKDKLTFERENNLENSDNENETNYFSVVFEELYESLKDESILKKRNNVEHSENEKESMPSSLINDSKETSSKDLVSQVNNDFESNPRKKIFETLSKIFKDLGDQIDELRKLENIVEENPNP